MVSKKSFSNVIPFFLKWLMVIAYNPGPMCQGVEDTVLGQNVVVAVPMGVLVHMGQFSCILMLEGYFGVLRKLGTPKRGWSHYPWESVVN